MPVDTLDVHLQELVVEDPVGVGRHLQRFLNFFQSLSLLRPFLDCLDQIDEVPDVLLDVGLGPRSSMPGCQNFKIERGQDPESRHPIVRVGARHDSPGEPSDTDRVGHKNHFAIGNKDNDVVVGLIGTRKNEANLKITQKHRELVRKGHMR